MGLCWIFAFENNQFDFLEGEICDCSATTRMGPRNYTHVACSSCVWFIFNLDTKSRFSQIIYYSIYTSDEIHTNPAPCPLSPSILLTWRTSFLARGANTHPLLSLVCCQLPTLCCFSQPSTPHRSSYNIYIDDINNISHSRLTQWLRHLHFWNQPKIVDFSYHISPISR